MTLFYFFSISRASFYHVVIPELCFLYAGNTHVVILDFMMESQVRMKNESDAA